MKFKLLRCDIHFYRLLNEGHATISYFNKFKHQTRVTRANVRVVRYFTSF